MHRGRDVGFRLPSTQPVGYDCGLRAAFRHLCMHGVAAGAVFDLKDRKTAARQHPGQLDAAGEQIVLDETVRYAPMDGIDLLPAEVVHDEQVTATAEYTRHVGCGRKWILEVRKAVMTDHPIESRLDRPGSEGQAVHVTLHQQGIRTAPPGMLEHGSCHVDGDQPRGRGARLKKGDERPRAGADFQDRFGHAQLRRIRRQHPPQDFAAIRELLGIPYFRQGFEKRTPAIQIHLSCAPPAPVPAGG